MSISRWYGTWCDTCGVETDVMPSSKDSRALAKQSGWAVAVRDPDRPNGRLRDYCPDHRPADLHRRAERLRSQL